MNLGISFSKSNRSSGYRSVLNAITREKKYLYRWNKACSVNVAHSHQHRYKTEGCLRSVKVSHAVACTTKV